MSSVPSLRRRYWREAVLLILMAVPGLALLPPGLMWLYQQGWLWLWALGVLAAGAGAFAVRLAIRRRAAADAAELAAQASPATLGWGPQEQAAWAVVEAQALAAAPLQPSKDLWDDALVLMRGTVDAVAAHYYPGEKDARYRLTLPELLLLAERVAQDLRRAGLRHIPAVQHVRVSTLLKAWDLYDAHGDTVKTVWTAVQTTRRATALVSNPLAAVLRETGEALMGSLTGDLAARMQGQLTQMLVRETGRAAIDLYAGRLRLSAADLRALAEADAAGAATDLAHPVRVVLTGQVSAGKSSLLNALAQTVQRRTGVSPSRDGTGVLHLDQPERPRLVLADLPGLGHDGRGETALAAEAARADLILWVVAASDPGRAADREALEALRRQAEAAGVPLPPVRLVLTHVDLLSPRREWAPPYVLDGSDPRPKAQAIAQALTAAAQDLGLPESGEAVAVCTAGEVWNVDALWQQIAAARDAARQHQLDRLNRQAGAFSVSETARQVKDGAKAVWRALWGKEE